MSESDNEWGTQVNAEGQQSWFGLLSKDGGLCAMVTQYPGGYLACYRGKVLGMKPSLDAAVEACLDEHGVLMPEGS